MFTDLRSAHPGWTLKFTSGYCHGAQDEAIRKKPLGVYLYGAKYLDHYALGYFTGFATHRGPDAELEPWFGYVCRDGAE
jgi:hypothetical protein